MKVCKTAIILGFLAATTLPAQQASQTLPAPVSDILNRAIPSWMSLSGEERLRFESFHGAGFRDSGDSYLLERLRLNLAVRPTRWLRFQFEAQDSRVFGQTTRPAPASQKNPMDLRLGYAELGSAEGPVSFSAGRQAWVFGEGRLLADPNWSNVGRSFDGARLTLRSGARKLDLLGGICVKPNPSGFDRNTPGEHFYGAYGSLGKLAPNATIEPYVLWRLEHDYRSERGMLGHWNERTAGFRWMGKLPRGFDYAGEAAAQTGSLAGDRIRAWAGHWIVGHSLPDTAHRPRLFSEWNHASGDANPRDGIRGGFDPLFPSTHDKLGLTDLFTWINLYHWRTGFEYTVLRRVRFVLAHNSFWLANAHDGVYSGGKLIARSPDASAGRHIGHQGDIQATFSPTRTTQVNAGYGHLFPGQFLQRTTAHVPYHIVFCNVVQRF